MAWTIEFDPSAERELAKLDPQIARRVLRFLDQRVRPLENPRQLGAPLQGQKLGDYWKYRVGDHRIIARIEDAHIRILVLRIGHRRSIYRSR
jgi:mRNA interferase RelE/StbE